MKHPEIGVKHLEAAKKLRAALIKEHVNEKNDHFESTAVFGIVKESLRTDGRKGPCHYDLMPMHRLGDRPVYVVTLNQEAKNAENKHSREDLIMYYDYLCNHSPWSASCVTIDPAEALDEGMIFDARIDPFNIMQGCIVATRQPWEYGNCVVRLYAALVRIGLNKNFSFLLASNTTIAGGDKNKMVLGYNHAGHRPLAFGDMGVKEWANFIHGKRKFESGTYFVQSEYDGVQRAWGKKERKEEQAHIDLLKLMEYPEDFEERGWGRSKRVGYFNFTELKEFLKTFDMEVLREHEIVDEL